jgi:hypothetical protein
MTTLLIPTVELIAKAWAVAAVPDLLGKVATKLPDLPWDDNEFVQIMSVGGSPDPENPQSQPVVSFNCYAVKKDSKNPPWGQANHLATQLWRATYVKRWAPDPAVDLVMPNGYGRALVQSVVPMTEPKRVPSDPSQYAVYNIDLQFFWIPASEVIV